MQAQRKKRNADASHRNRLNRKTSATGPRTKGARVGVGATDGCIQHWDLGSHCASGLLSQMEWPAPTPAPRTRCPAPPPPLRASCLPASPVPQTRHSNAEYQNARAQA